MVVVYNGCHIVAHCNPHRYAHSRANCNHHQNEHANNASRVQQDFPLERHHSGR